MENESPQASSDPDLALPVVGEGGEVPRLPIRDPARDESEGEDPGATQLYVPPGSDEGDTLPLAGVETAPLEDEQGLVFGDFRLLKKLGQGAMAMVYKAHQVSFDRTVALKILFKHIADNPRLVERFDREARLAGSLGHPNLVEGYAVGEDDGWHYLVMEYVNGRSLQAWLTRRGSLAVGDALHITLACARALAYAHDLDLVHRDIKPDNVLIGRRGQVKVADLGMVKVLDEDMSMTQTGHAVGTPWYMPLEQARNAKDTDRRSDIYALGCMLYCMLTGRPPFAGANIVEVIEAKEVGTFPRARHSNAEVPERLDLIIAKMTAKLPRNRYASCAEVIRDLEALGLDYERLSFLPGARGRGRPRGRLVRKRKREAVAPRTPAEPSPADIASEIWLVRYETPAGPALRKLTRGQLLKLVQDKDFDPRATARPMSEPHFRAVAAYPEFAPYVLGRAPRQGLDAHSGRYRDIYKKIEAEEAARRRVRPGKLKLLLAGVRSWLTNLPRFAWIAVALAAFCGLAILVIQWLT
jgi:serine/threonine-protein kinase